MSNSCSSVCTLIEAYPCFGFFFQAEDGIRDAQESRGLGDVYKRQGLGSSPFARHYSGNVLFSSGYLDVSVPRVPPAHPMYSDDSAWAFPQAGFPIRISPALTLDDSSPRLFAAIHVLLRLLAPRHPPYALTNLIHVRRHSLNVFYPLPSPSSLSCHLHSHNSVVNVLGQITTFQ